MRSTSRRIFFIPADELPKWEYLKGSKKLKRVNKQTGFEYDYSEGSMAFPDHHTSGVSDIRRAFLMGNALVTGIIEKIGMSILLRSEI